MRLAAKHRLRPMSAFDTTGDLQVDSCLTQSGRVELIRVGRGEPIVLVPGLAGGWRLLTPLARSLARTNEVILCGFSGDEEGFAPPRGASLTDHARDLDEVLTGLGLERPTVLGVSFGGAVALELAAERPGRLGALVVSGMEARFGQGIGPRIALRVLEHFPLPPDSGFINQFFNLLHGGRPPAGELAEFIVRRIWETDQGVMAARLRALSAFDVSDRLWRIDCPTLVLAGSRDVIVPAAGQSALAESISGARFETLTGAGHVGFLTHRVEFGRHVGRLLRDRQRARR